MPDTEFGTQTVVQRGRCVGNGVGDAERGKRSLEIDEFAGELGRIEGGIETGEGHDLRGLGAVPGQILGDGLGWRAKYTPV